MYGISFLSSFFTVATSVPDYVYAEKMCRRDDLLL